MESDCSEVGGAGGEGFWPPYSGVLLQDCGKNVDVRESNEKHVTTMMEPEEMYGVISIMVIYEQER
jgi:hypothetical protein